MHSNTLMIDVETGGAGDLVDLLRRVGEQQRHAEVLSKCGFELLRTRRGVSRSEPGSLPTRRWRGESRANLSLKTGLFQVILDRKKLILALKRS
jgi:hypothetical protein